MTRLRYKNPKTSLIIAVDDLVHCWNPLLASDYSSKFILSSLYEPLMHNVNCSIANINKVFYEIHLEDNYIGTANEIRNCILFHLDKDSNSPYRGLFLCIKNAKKIVSDWSLIDDLGVDVIDSKKLIIELEYEAKDFLSIIQSFFVLPISRNKKLVPNGPYILNKQAENSIIVKRNLKFRFKNSNIETIIFKLYKEPLKFIEDYKLGLVDITCHTQFPFPKESYQIYEDYCESPLDLIYILRCKSLDIKKAVNSKIQEQFYKQKLFKEINITAGINLLGKKINYSKDLNYDSNQKKEDNGEVMKLYYSEYYPNDLLASALKDYFQTYGLELELYAESDFGTFLNTNNNSDLMLDLVMPSYEHYFSYIRAFIYEFNIEERRSIVSLTNEQSEKAYLELNSFFKSSPYTLPLGKGAAIYLKDPQLQGYGLNTLGLLDLKNIYWGQLL